MDFPFSAHFLSFDRSDRNRKSETKIAKFASCHHRPGVFMRFFVLPGDGRLRVTLSTLSPGFEFKKMATKEVCRAKYDILLIGSNGACYSQSRPGVTKDET